jgi:hypothetical protein
MLHHFAHSAPLGGAFHSAGSGPSSMSTSVSWTIGASGSSCTSNEPHCGHRLVLDVQHGPTEQLVVAREHLEIHLDGILGEIRSRGHHQVEARDLAGAVGERRLAGPVDDPLRDAKLVHVLPPLRRRLSCVLPRRSSARAAAVSERLSTRKHPIKSSFDTTFNMFRADSCDTRLVYACLSIADVVEPDM